jgi:hypothetical protein
VLLCVPYCWGYDILRPYCSWTWSNVAFVCHTHYSGHFQNILCCVVTVCYASVTPCHIVGDDTFCFWNFPPYCWKTWHTVAIMRHTYNSGSFQNMLCWIVTVWYSSATYCYIVPDIMFCCWNFALYCSNTWHTVAAVRHTNNSGSSHNMLCWVLTVWYNSAT